jgi:hypothetical protein
VDFGRLADVSEPQRLLRKIADQMDEAVALRQEIKRLRDVDAAAKTACTAWLTGADDYERVRSAMTALYRATRVDLWEEDQR